MSNDRQIRVRGSSNERRNWFSVADMARLVGLSRQRFHQLMTGGCLSTARLRFRTRRPHYTEELQTVCVSVGRRTSASTAESCCSMPVVWGPCQRNKSTPSGPLSPEAPTLRFDRRTEGAGDWRPSPSSRWMRHCKNCIPMAPLAWGRRNFCGPSSFISCDGLGGK